MAACKHCGSEMNRHPAALYCWGCKESSSRERHPMPRHPLFIHRLPEKSNGAVYVAEMQSGSIKIGKTINPRARISEINKYVSGFSDSVARVKLHHVGKYATRLEKLCLIAMRTFAKPQTERGTEHFLGATFAQAISLVKTCRHRDLPKPKREGPTQPRNDKPSSKRAK